jgi:hypothetical protein
MSIVQQVGRVVANTEAAGRVAEFTQAVRYLMINPRGGADRLAEKEHAPSRVVDFTKAAAAAGSMTGWGQPLAPFQNLSTAFLSSLSAISAFDALWPSMLQVPLRTSVIAVSTTLTAGPIAEASVKPASRISITASDLDAVKCAAFLALSAELLKSGNPSALTILQNELRIAIARCTNSVFLPILTASAPSFVSAGITATGVRQDLRVLLSQIAEKKGPLAGPYVQKVEDNPGRRLSQGANGDLRTCPLKRSRGLVTSKLAVNLSCPAGAGFSSLRAVRQCAAVSRWITQPSLRLGSVISRRPLVPLL